MELKTAEGYSAKVGDKVAGAEGGYVQKADDSNVTVWEVRSNSVIVIKNS
jgi:hypothetical protein